MSLRSALLQALEDRYNAQISESDATIQIYLEKPVAIGEHPQHLMKQINLLKKFQLQKKNQKYYNNLNYDPRRQFRI